MASNMPDGFICRCPPVSAVVRSLFKEHALFQTVCDKAERKPGFSKFHSGGFFILAPSEANAWVFQSQLLKYSQKQ